MMHSLRYLVVSSFLISGCGAFAMHDSGAPAAHHAQRKYDEAVRKGTVVPAEKGTEDQK